MAETGYEIPVARRAATVTPADTGTNCKGAIGLHNATSAGGAIKVTLTAQAGGGTVTLWVAAGAVLYLQFDNVWATPAPPATVVAFFG